jgi:hypothetical protein
MSKMNRLLAKLFRPSDSLPVMPRMHPYNFLLQLQPAVQQGCRTADRTGSRHALTELALVSYLMGMGFDHRTARAIVETWETDEAIKEDGILE